CKLYGGVFHTQRFSLLTCAVSADCKYKFGSWGECDTATGSKNRSGTLKKALYNAECQPTIKVSKPCPSKTKTKAKGKKGSGKEN
ncbi:midkine-A-like, partial [Coregonus clupeaformis]|uniref:midkine-A-like n=1 Tax=Coregonus clupeaformis TaxID=59861 RepID=UPI001E1C59FA